MSEKPSPPEASSIPIVKRLQSVLGGTTVIVALISGLLLEIPKLREAFENLFPAAKELPAIKWTLLGIVAVLGIVLWLKGRTESRLAPGANLRLDRDNPNHLVGRVEEVEALAAACHDHPQVHLVGEAGAGKSALVRAGLIPKLKADGKLLPMYVNGYGEDWIHGPRCALAEALWDAMTEGQRNQLGLTGRSDIDRLKEHLDNFSTRIDRRPLLIFDQLDDYQLRHAAIFLTGKKNVWLTPGELTKRNAFWHMVKQALVSDKVRVLFVTADKMGEGLAAMCFTSEPLVRRLPRLPSQAARDVLSLLTTSAAGAPPLVLEPEKGWDDLCERLAHDLEEDGAILPARIKVALLGLPRLRALTIKSYERYGGLSALEAGHVEFHIREAARASAGLISPDQVRQALLQLVDRDELKTIGKPLNVIRQGVT